MNIKYQERPSSWIPDEDIKACQLCLISEFGSFERKHHCRSCGKVVCSSCSDAKLLIPLDEAVLPPQSAIHKKFLFDPRYPQRCCLNCAEILKPRQEHLRSTIAYCSSEVLVERDALKRYFNNPLKLSLQDEIIKATHTLRNFTGDNRIEGEDRIPMELIKSSKGLAFITMVRAGLFFSGKIGTGLVVARRPDGSWSAPSAIACAGIGWGFQAGGDVTDVVIILNTQKAVEALSGRGSVSLGTQLSLCVGPVGRAASTDVRAGDAGIASAFSYAHSKGLFAGASFEAGTIVSRSEANRAFYGISVSPKELLLGSYPSPIAAEVLYEAIREVESFSSTDQNCSAPVDSKVDKIEDILLDGASRGGIENSGIFRNIKGKLCDAWQYGLVSTEPANQDDEDWVKQRHQRVLAMRKHDEMLSGLIATELKPLKHSNFALSSKNLQLESSLDESSEEAIELWENILGPEYLDTENQYK